MIATISRSGAVVARWAHNPKVIGSSPVSATNKKVTYISVHHFFIYAFYTKREYNDYFRLFIADKSIFGLGLYFSRNCSIV